MDIGSGKGYPSSALSNFAPHEFIIDGITCQSMEDYAARFFGYNFSYILELIINEFLKNNERMINLFSLPDLDDEQMDIEIFYFANYYYDIQKLKVEHFYEILEITKNELDRELNCLLNFQKNIYECEEEYKRITNR